MPSFQAGVGTTGDNKYYINAVSFSVCRTEYGWAGHTNNSGVWGSVREVVEQVSLHTVDKVMRGIKVKSMTNKKFPVSLDSVKVWRLNFPDNCYSLDLTNNREVREKGIKQLILDFYILKNYSVEILLEGQSLAGYRMIKAHRSQSMGDAIRLDDLGEKEFSKLI